MIDYDDILDCYASTNSLRKTSAECGVSIQVVRRVLAASGVYSSDLTQAINLMYSNGITVDEIANRLGILPKSVYAHLPHARTSYVVGEKTNNAYNITKWRKHKKQLNGSERQIN